LDQHEQKGRRNDYPSDDEVQALVSRHRQKGKQIKDHQQYSDREQKFILASQEKPVQ